MIGPTYYSFIDADQAATGAAMLEAEDASRYGTVLLGPVMQTTGETDAEGNPVMEDAGLGYILAVLDRQSPDPVPGWEAAQVKAELVPHEWAGRRIDALAMDEECTDRHTPINRASRPTEQRLRELREARVAERQAAAKLRAARIEYEQAKVMERSDDEATALAELEKERQEFLRQGRPPGRVPVNSD